MWHLHVEGVSWPDCCGGKFHVVSLLPAFAPHSQSELRSVAQVSMMMMIMITMTLVMMITLNLMTNMIMMEVTNSHSSRSFTSEPIGVLFG